MRRLMARTHICNRVEVVGDGGDGSGHDAGIQTRQHEEQGQRDENQIELGAGWVSVLGLSCLSSGRIFDSVERRRSRWRRCE